MGLYFATEIIMPAIADYNSFQVHAAEEHLPSQFICSIGCPREYQQPDAQALQVHPGLHLEYMGCVSVTLCQSTKEWVCCPLCELHHCRVLYTMEKHYKTHIGPAIYASILII